MDFPGTRYWYSGRPPGTRYRVPGVYQVPGTGYQVPDQVQVPSTQVGPTRYQVPFTRYWVPVTRYVPGTRYIPGTSGTGSEDPTRPTVLGIYDQYLVGW